MTRIASLLVVDDARFMREVIRSALAECADRIALAGDACEAIEKARTEQPEVVTLDLTLDAEEETAGLRALDGLLAASPRSRVLVVSALDQDWLRAAARARGAAGYLKKPFDEAELRAAVAALREGHK